MRISKQVDESEQRQWCSANFVNGRALRKAVDIHAQLSAQLASDQSAATTSAVASGDAKQSGSELQGAGGGSADAEDTAGLRRAITAGLAVHGAMRQPDGEAFASSISVQRLHKVHGGCMQILSA